MAATPPLPGAGIIDVPGVEGGIRGQVGRAAPQRGDGLLVQGGEPDDVLVVERLGRLGKNKIAMHGSVVVVMPEPYPQIKVFSPPSSWPPRRLAPKRQSGSPAALLRIEPVGDRLFGVVLAHPTHDVLDIHSHGGGEAGDQGGGRPHGAGQQGGQGRLIEGALLVAQPPVARHGARRIEAVGTRWIEDGTKAEFEDEQRMGQQKRSQLGDVRLPFVQFDEQGFDIGRRRVRPRTRPVPETSRSGTSDQSMCANNAR